MGRNYLETVFRHPLLVVLPLVIAFVAGASYGLTRPRSYTATAVVWTDSRIPGESTIGTTGGQAPPSAGQAALFGQLLTSRSFLLAVARETPLRESISGLPGQQVDEVLARMAGTLTMSTAGPQVLSVTAEQSSPALATGVANAVVEQAIRVETDRLRQRAEAQVSYDKQQVDTAAKAVADAHAALLQYRRTRPVDATGEDDLSGAAALAQQQYADAQKTYTMNSATLQHVADESFLSVLDAPERAYTVSRRMTVLVGAVGGILAGGTLAVLALLLLMLRDRGIREERELVDELGLHVVATIDKVQGGASGPAPDARPTFWQRTAGAPVTTKTST